MAFTNQSKNTAVISNEFAVGRGWFYEESDIDYEMTDLYYEKYGVLQTFTNQAVNSANITNLAKS
ncbi:MAG: hypothetical protein GY861_18325 [bacterium]|nr:hypothetical protein [bacterium]